MAETSNPQSNSTHCVDRNPQSDSRAALLEIKDLRVYFHTEDGILKAVDGVSLQMKKGETLGLVGESGCGKSVTAYAILQLLPTPPARYEGGEILFCGENLLAKNESQLRSLRGNRLAMIFQEPMSSLNPIMTIGKQITEAIFEHQKKSKSEAREIAVEMLRRVRIPSPETRFNEYPHQLSGGMKQRAMIAMALICKPQLLIADEPTTALDVTIQAQILEVLKELQHEFAMSVLLITHDLGVVAETCDQVAVMYAGKIVEYATVNELFENPKHPYTHGLFRSLPNLSARQATLEAIPGAVPNPLDFPTGCRFRTRCPLAQDLCKQEPPLGELAPQHFVACHFAE
ncbi:MAG: ABC transporter ATP-binding protein [Acidobacteria bacterium]|nr:ABC transporter ATP-binding protein [Acidobacteriota bacterium]